MTITTTARQDVSALIGSRETPAEDRRKPIRESHYPDHCKNILLSFLDLIESREWTQAEAARKVKHGPSKNAITSGALSQLLTGKYKADPSALCASIDRVVNLESGRAIFTSNGFVQTRMYKTMTEMADIAIITQGITCVHGGLLAGKTTNAGALAHLYDKASPIFMTAPYADSYGGFVKRLAAVRGVESRGTLSDVRERILQSFDSSHLLIIDEFHQPITHYSYSQAKRVFEFIREINDLCRCGILLIGASVGYETIMHDETFERIAASLYAKDITPFIPGKGNNETDLQAIAKTYGLPDPGEADLALCRDIVSHFSVGRLFEILKLAAGASERRGESLTWSTVQKIQGTLLKLN